MLVVTTLTMTMLTRLFLTDNIYFFTIILHISMITFSN